MTRKVLNGWMIALINIAAVCNIKNFPLLAEYGLSIVLFLILSAIFYFIPVAFVSAELASAWPDRGVYTWVKEGLGSKWGFLAIALQWTSNVIWYPTILSVIAGTLAYIINPDLATNNTYVMWVILVAFWSATFINFLGMKVSGWISSITALFGTIIPMTLIIVLGGVWIVGDHPSQIIFKWENLFPDFSSLNQFVLLSGVLLGLSGLEMSAVHARDVQNPRRDYPKGIFISAVAILIFSIFGALAIAAVIPKEKIELASGAMEAFRLLFQAFHMPWATPLIAIVSLIGALGMMSTWIVGPSRGLLGTAEHGDLPPLFQKINKKGMPVNILIAQAVIVSALSFVFLFMPTVNSSYWALVALASILYQILYILMFIAAIKLRKRHPKLERPYKVPFGAIGMWTFSLFGIFGSFFGFFFGFFPPSQFATGKLVLYELFLIGTTILFCGLPLCIFAQRKPSWHKKNPS
ncbi:MAG TPA: amino acid permease [Chlamydiales bacterium]|nr:amino acid permease [Chlamydiales bacterium]